MKKKPTANCKHAQFIIDTKWHYLESEITDGCWSCGTVLSPSHLFIHKNLDKISMDDAERKRLESDPVAMEKTLAFLNRPMWECRLCNVKKYEIIEKEIAEGKMVSMEECIRYLEPDRRIPWLIAQIAEIESCVPDCPDRTHLEFWKEELRKLQS